MDQLAHSRRDFLVNNSFAVLSFAASMPQAPISQAGDFRLDTASERTLFLETIGKLVGAKYAENPSENRLAQVQAVRVPLQSYLARLEAVIRTDPAQLSAEEQVSVQELNQLLGLGVQKLNFARFVDDLSETKRSEGVDYAISVLKLYDLALEHVKQERPEGLASDYEERIFRDLLYCNAYADSEIHEAVANIVYHHFIESASPEEKSTNLKQTLFWQSKNEHGIGSRLMLRALDDVSLLYPQDDMDKGRLDDTQRANSTLTEGQIVLERLIVLAADIRRDHRFSPDQKLQLDAWLNTTYLDLLRMDFGVCERAVARLPEPTDLLDAPLQFEKELSILKSRSKLLDQLKLNHLLSAQSLEGIETCFGARLIQPCRAKMSDFTQGILSLPASRSGIIGQGRELIQVYVGVKSLLESTFVCPSLGRAFAESRENWIRSGVSNVNIRFTNTVASFRESLRTLSEDSSDALSELEDLFALRRECIDLEQGEISAEQKNLVDDLHSFLNLSVFPQIESMYAGASSSFFKLPLVKREQFLKDTEAFIFSPVFLQNGLTSSLLGSINEKLKNNALEDSTRAAYLALASELPDYFDIHKLFWQHLATAQSEFVIEQGLMPLLYRLQKCDSLDFRQAPLGNLLEAAIRSPESVTQAEVQGNELLELLLLVSHGTLPNAVAEQGVKPMEIQLLRSNAMQLVSKYFQVAYVSEICDAPPSPRQALTRDARVLLSSGQVKPLIPDLLASIDSQAADGLTGTPLVHAFDAYSELQYRLKGDLRQTPAPEKTLRAAGADSSFDLLETRNNSNLLANLYFNILDMWSTAKFQRYPEQVIDFQEQRELEHFRHELKSFIDIEQKKTALGLALTTFDNHVELIFEQGGEHDPDSRVAAAAAREVLNQLNYFTAERNFDFRVLERETTRDYRNLLQQAFESSLQQEAEALKQILGAIPGLERAALWQQQVIEENILVRDHSLDMIRLADGRAFQGSFKSLERNMLSFECQDGATLELPASQLVDLSFASKEQSESRIDSAMELYLRDGSTVAGNTFSGMHEKDTINFEAASCTIQCAQSQLAAIRLSQLSSQQIQSFKRLIENRPTNDLLIVNRGGDVDFNVIDAVVEKIDGEMITAKLLFGDEEIRKEVRLDKLAGIVFHGQHMQPVARHGGVRIEARGGTHVTSSLMIKDGKCFVAGTQEKGGYQIPLEDVVAVGFSGTGSSISDSASEAHISFSLLRDQISALTPRRRSELAPQDPLVSEVIHRLTVPCRLQEVGLRSPHLSLTVGSELTVELPSDRALRAQFLNLELRAAAPSRGEAVVQLYGKLPRQREEVFLRAIRIQPDGEALHIDQNVQDFEAIRIALVPNERGTGLGSAFLVSGSFR